MATVKEWTMKEIQFLRDNEETMTQEEISERLGRSKAAVRNQALRQGLTILTDSYFKLYKQDYALYNGEELVTIGTIAEIAEHVGKSFKTVAYWRYCHLRKTKLILVD